MVGSGDNLMDSDVKDILSHQINGLEAIESLKQSLEQVRLRPQDSVQVLTSVFQTAEKFPNLFMELLENSKFQFTLVSLFVEVHVDDEKYRRLFDVFISVLKSQRFEFWELPFVNLFLRLFVFVWLKCSKISPDLSVLCLEHLINISNRYLHLNFSKKALLCCVLCYCYVSGFQDEREDIIGIKNLLAEFDEHSHLSNNFFKGLFLEKRLVLPVPNKVRLLEFQSVASLFRALMKPLDVLYIEKKRLRESIASFDLLFCSEVSKENTNFYSICPKDSSFEKKNNRLALKAKKGTSDSGPGFEGVGSCTFEVTDKRFTYQPWFNCRTCSDNRDKGCCLFCAVNCHAGHNISFSKASRFFCDCGAQDKELGSSEFCCDNSISSRNFSKPKTRFTSTLFLNIEAKLNSKETLLKQLISLTRVGQLQSTLNSNESNKNSQKRFFDFLSCFVRSTTDADELKWSSKRIESLRKKEQWSLKYVPDRVFKLSIKVPKPTIFAFLNPLSVVEEFPEGLVFSDSRIYDLISRDSARNSDIPLGYYTASNFAFKCVLDDKVMIGYKMHLSIEMEESDISLVMGPFRRKIDILAKSTASEVDGQIIQSLSITLTPLEVYYCVFLGEKIKIEFKDASGNPTSVLLIGFEIYTSSKRSYFFNNYVLPVRFLQKVFEADEGSIAYRTHKIHRVLSYLILGKILICSNILGSAEHESQVDKVQKMFTPSPFSMLTSIQEFCAQSFLQVVLQSPNWSSDNVVHCSENMWNLSLWNLSDNHEGSKIDIELLNDAPVGVVCAVVKREVTSFYSTVDDCNIKQMVSRGSPNVRYALCIETQRLTIQSWSKENSQNNEEYRCDSCNKYPITIARAHCQICPDFDLCLDCFPPSPEAHAENHIFQIHSIREVIRPSLLAKEQKQVDKSIQLVQSSWMKVLNFLADRAENMTPSLFKAEEIATICFLYSTVFLHVPAGVSLDHFAPPNLWLKEICKRFISMPLQAQWQQENLYTFCIITKLCETVFSNVAKKGILHDASEVRGLGTILFNLLQIFEVFVSLLTKLYASKIVSSNEDDNNVALVAIRAIDVSLYQGFWSRFFHTHLISCSAKSVHKLFGSIEIRSYVTTSVINLLISMLNILGSLNSRSAIDKSTEKVLAETLFKVVEKESGKLVSTAKTALGALGISPEEVEEQSSRHLFEKQMKKLQCLLVGKKQDFEFLLIQTLAELKSSARERTTHFSRFCFENTTNWQSNETDPIAVLMLALKTLKSSHKVDVFELFYFASASVTKDHKAFAVENLLSVCIKSLFSSELENLQLVSGLLLKQLCEKKILEYEALIDSLNSYLHNNMEAIKRLPQKLFGLIYLYLNQLDSGKKEIVQAELKNKVGKLYRSLLEVFVNWCKSLRRQEFKGIITDFISCEEKVSTFSSYVKKPMSSNPCSICWSKAEPEVSVSLDSVKIDARYSSNSEILQMKSTRSINWIALTIHPLLMKRNSFSQNLENYQNHGLLLTSVTSGNEQVFLTSVKVYYCNSISVSRLGEMRQKDFEGWVLGGEFNLKKSKAQKGKNSKTNISKPKNESSHKCKLEFVHPIVCSHLKFEYYFQDQRGNQVLVLPSDRVCPRCEVVLSSRERFCSQCGEDSRQCRLCRKINYEDNTPFLCVECGHCRYLRLSYTMCLTESPIWPEIKTDADFQAALIRIDDLVKEKLLLNREMKAIISANKRLVEPNDLTHILVDFKRASTYEELVKSGETKKVTNKKGTENGSPVVRRIRSETLSSFINSFSQDQIGSLFDPRSIFGTDRLDRLRRLQRGSQSRTVTETTDSRKPQEEKDSEQDNRNQAFRNYLLCIMEARSITARLTKYQQNGALNSGLKIQSVANSSGLFQGQCGSCLLKGILLCSKVLQMYIEAFEDKSFGDSEIFEITKASSFLLIPVVEAEYNCPRASISQLHMTNIKWFYCVRDIYVHELKMFVDILAEPQDFVLSMRQKGTLQICENSLSVFNEKGDLQSLKFFLFAILEIILKCWHILKDDSKLTVGQDLLKNSLQLLLTYTTINCSGLCSTLFCIFFLCSLPRRYAKSPQTFLNYLRIETLKKKYGAEKTPLLLDLLSLQMPDERPTIIFLVLSCLLNKEENDDDTFSIVHSAILTVSSLINCSIERHKKQEDLRSLFHTLLFVSFLDVESTTFALVLNGTFEKILQLLEARVSRMHDVSAFEAVVSGYRILEIQSILMLCYQFSSSLVKIVSSRLDIVLKLLRICLTVATPQFTQLLSQKSLATSVVVSFLNSLKEKQRCTILARIGTDMLETKLPVDIGLFHWFGRFSTLLGIIDNLGVEKVEEPNLDFEIYLQRSPSQEDYFPGMLSRNPLLFSEIAVEQNVNDSNGEPTFADLRRKIAQDLDFLHAMDLIEFIIDGKIISPELSIRQVYEQIWLSSDQRSHTDSEFYDEDDEIEEDEDISVGEVETVLGNFIQQNAEVKQKKKCRSSSILGSRTKKEPWFAEIFNKIRTSKIAPFFTSLDLDILDKLNFNDRKDSFDDHLNDLPSSKPMRVIYRICGMDGEATEEIVKSLPAMMQDEPEKTISSQIPYENLEGSPLLLTTLRMLSKFSGLVEKQRKVVEDQTHVFTMGLRYATKFVCNRDACRDIVNNNGVKIFFKCLQQSLVDFGNGERCTLIVAIIDSLYKNYKIPYKFEQWIEESFNFYLEMFENTANFKALYENDSLLEKVSALYTALCLPQEALSNKFTLFFPKVVENVFLAKTKINKNTKEIRNQMKLLLFGLSGENGQTMRSELFSQGITQKCIQRFTTYLQAFSPTRKRKRKEDSNSSLHEFADCSHLELLLKFLEVSVIGNKEAESFVLSSGALRRVYDFEKLPSSAFQFENLSSIATFRKSDNSSVRHLNESCAEFLSKYTTSRPELKKQIEAWDAESKKMKLRKAQKRRNKVLRRLSKAKTQNNKRLKSDQLSWEAAASKLTDDTGLTCVVCFEGFSFRPDKVLGVYSFSKTFDVAEAPAIFKPVFGCNVAVFNTRPTVVSLGSTVTSFNTVHFSCHDAAVKADESKPQSSEWAGAQIRNGHANCNNLLPLRGGKTSKVSLSSYKAMCARYLDVLLNQIMNLGLSCSFLTEEQQRGNRHVDSADIQAMLQVVMFDLRSLLLRFAYKENLSVDTNGGGRTDNMKLIVPLLQLSSMLLEEIESSSPGFTKECYRCILQSLGDEENCEDMEGEAIVFLLTSTLLFPQIVDSSGEVINVWNSFAEKIESLLENYRALAVNKAEEQGFLTGSMVKSSRRRARTMSVSTVMSEKSEGKMSETKTFKESCGEATKILFLLLKFFHTKCLPFDSNESSKVTVLQSWLLDEDKAIKDCIKLADEYRNVFLVPKE